MPIDLRWDVLEGNRDLSFLGVDFCGWLGSNYFHLFFARLEFS